MWVHQEETLFVLCVRRLSVLECRVRTRACEFAKCVLDASLAQWTWSWHAQPSQSIQYRFVPKRLPRAPVTLGSGWVTSSARVCRVCVLVFDKRVGAQQRDSIPRSNGAQYRLGWWANQYQNSPVGIGLDKKKTECCLRLFLGL